MNFSNPIKLFSLHPSGGEETKKWKLKEAVFVLGGLLRFWPNASIIRHFQNYLSNGKCSYFWCCYFSSPSLSLTLYPPLHVLLTTQQTVKMNSDKKFLKTFQENFTFLWNWLFLLVCWFYIDSILTTDYSFYSLPNQTSNHRCWMGFSVSIRFQSTR